VSHSATKEKGSFQCSNIVGTLLYMAPEIHTIQPGWEEGVDENGDVIYPPVYRRYEETDDGRILHEETDVRPSVPHSNKVDAWALGIIIYKMVTGCSPYQNTFGYNEYDEAMLVHQLLKGNVSRITNQGAFPAGMSDQCKALIEALLSKNVHKRPSIQDVVASLDPCNKAKYAGTALGSNRWLLLHAKKASKAKYKDTRDTLELLTKRHSKRIISKVKKQNKEIKRRELARIKHLPASERPKLREALKQRLKGRMFWKRQEISPRQIETWACERNRHVNAIENADDIVKMINELKYVQSYQDKMNDLHASEERCRKLEKETREKKSTGDMFRPKAEMSILKKKKRRECSPMK